MNYKHSVNLITNPNPIYSHTKLMIIFIIERCKERKIQCDFYMQYIPSIVVLILDGFCMLLSLSQFYKHLSVLI
jgi:hypothetical protein